MPQDSLSFLTIRESQQEDSIRELAVVKNLLVCMLFLLFYGTTTTMMSFVLFCIARGTILSVGLSWYGDELGCSAKREKESERMRGGVGKGHCYALRQGEQRAACAVASIGAMRGPTFVRSLARSLRYPTDPAQGQLMGA